MFHKSLIFLLLAQITSVAPDLRQVFDMETSSHTATIAVLLDKEA